MRVHVSPVIETDVVWIDHVERNTNQDRDGDQPSAAAAAGHDGQRICVPSSPSASTHGEI